MKIQLRSSFSTQGRRMAGARALWVANGMKKEMIGKPIVAIVNSFTQFVPGHTHLHEIGQQVKAEIEKLGCFAAEFNTIAVDDGIAMGHDGMLYSLPSRDIIADSVEYMVNAHKAGKICKVPLSVQQTIVGRSTLFAPQCLFQGIIRNIMCSGRHGIFMNSIQIFVFTHHVISPVL